ncbi:NTP pyrophosphatase (non-canonical NTP hydrolase) [Pseudarthrobacter oxydans]|uniref:nucleotide pyrophosphohydrolase n=1 Tax=Pseudarthrobacter oxydans TaxID=1671 RepID=UPI00278161D4|nr:nucleotide pyrophosphohydrolase [Pseudarthrobacter oxydans]MDP9982956.1 NTP pyrophosphatase (non-canonical NTP hydrolase) [Pseudarthrobacter oxydans]
MTSDFDDLVLALEQFKEERDWGQFHTPKNLALAICGEAGELASELQWVGPEELSDNTVDRAMEEAADVLLYLISFSRSVNRDLLAAAFAKLEKNGRNYPVDKSRGTSAKYNQL